MHLNSWTIPSNIIKINLSAINYDVLYNHVVIRTSDFFHSLHVILTQFTSIEIWIYELFFKIDNFRQRYMYYTCTA